MRDFKKLRILEKGSAERSVKFTEHVRFGRTSKSGVRSRPTIINQNMDLETPSKKRGYNNNNMPDKSEA